jgi:hypothetical protein
MNELYVAEVIKKGALKAQVVADHDPTSPREWDNVGKMVCWHRRYNLGDEQPKNIGPDEFLLSLMRDREQRLFYKDVPDDIAEEHVQKYLEKHYYILPLYLYDHSGITMRCEPFGCRWDSGQVGWIYCSKEDAEKECLPDPEACLEAEVAVYDQYLRGDVYGYEILDEDGECLDSCWGFFGLDSCVEEAKSALERSPYQL